MYKKGELQMICKHAYRLNESENGRHYLQCLLMKNQCPMIRFCSKVNDIINVDNVESKCTIYKNEEDKSYMKQGKYKVLYEKRGMLYIELNQDTSIVISNPFNNVPSGVDVVKIKDEYYIKGYEPKIEKKEYTKVKKES